MCIASVGQEIWCQDFTQEQRKGGKMTRKTTDAVSGPGKPVWVRKRITSNMTVWIPRISLNNHRIAKDKPERKGDWRKVGCQESRSGR